MRNPNARHATHKRETAMPELLLDRLQDSDGRFKVKQRNRFLRVIVDLDGDGADLENWQYLLAEVQRQILSGITLSDVGTLGVVGLAGRVLEAGETSIGYDPALLVAFGIDPAERVPKQDRGTQNGGVAAREGQRG